MLFTKYRQRLNYGFAVFLGGLILLPLCFASGRAENIVLGMSAAFSGPSRGLGIELYRGSMAYFDHLNQNGGIHGNQVVVKAYDDGYNPTPAIQNTIKLIEQDNVFLLFNYVGTPTVTRVLPLLKNFSRRSVYLFFPFTGAEPQRRPPYNEFVFNLRASYGDETRGLVDHFLRIGRPRIAMFYQADAYGRSGWEGVRNALALYGAKMVGEATYRRGMEFSQSLKQQVEILRKAEPDAIISIGSYAACAAFIRDARSAGWSVPIANVSFVGSENLAALLLASGSATDITTNVINSQVVPSYEDTALPAVREYRERMERFGAKLPGLAESSDYRPVVHSFVSFEGYLNAKLLSEILLNMRGAAKAQIKYHVEKSRAVDIGIGAPISFGPSKHQGLDKVYFTTLEKGRFVPLVDWERWRK